VLLDTHILIWYAANDPRLSAAAIRAIRAGGNYYSAASVWEAAIKAGLGKLDLRHGRKRVSTSQFFSLVAGRLQLTSIPITDSAAAAIESLPMHHADPFDRLLIAQAVERELAIVSADPAFDRYGVRRIF
jgi:PIN domain nuclease of toxin-antitoxin system